MKYLVDTNVLSELTKQKPNQKVVDWMKANEGSLFVSTITLGELSFEISVLAEGRRKLALQNWLKQTARLMTGHTLSFNRSAAYVWADMRAAARAQGKSITLADGLIAATAKRHELIVATRNTNDFLPTNVRTINPFE